MPPTDDPFVAQELVETLYHVLWELVHVFFDHRGLLEGRTAGTVHDAGASSFLYPFLAEREHDLEARDRGRAPLGADEGGGGRRAAPPDAGRGRRTRWRMRPPRLRACFEAGGKLLALGNGGSATDAMDAVADFRSPPARGRRGLRSTSPRTPRS